MGYVFYSSDRRLLLAVGRLGTEEFLKSTEEVRIFTSAGFLHIDTEFPYTVNNSIYSNHRSNPASVARWCEVYLQELNCFTNSQASLANSKRWVSNAYRQLILHFHIFKGIHWVSSLVRSWKGRFWWVRWGRYGVVGLGSWRWQGEGDLCLPSLDFLAFAIPDLFLASIFEGLAIAWWSVFNNWKRYKALLMKFHNFQQSDFPHLDFALWLCFTATTK